MLNSLLRMAPWVIVWGDRCSDLASIKIGGHGWLLDLTNGKLLSIDAKPRADDVWDHQLGKKFQES